MVKLYFHSLTSDTENLIAGPMLLYDEGSRRGYIRDGGGDGGAASETTLPEPNEIAGRAKDLWRKTLPRRALSRLLRRMRRHRNLSQTVVAKRMGTTQPEIARMESATGPWPNQEKIAAFSAACDQVAVLGFIDAETAERGGTADEEPRTKSIEGEFVFFPLGESVESHEPDPARRVGLEHGSVYGVVAATQLKVRGEEQGT